MNDKDINQAIRQFTGVERDDFTKCLNAMHEAESCLDQSGQNSERNHYGRILGDLVHPDMTMNDDWFAWCMCHATAAQRAEALLRTIGKWKE